MPTVLDHRASQDDTRNNYLSVNQGIRQLVSSAPDINKIDSDMQQQWQMKPDQSTTDFTKQHSINKDESRIDDNGDLLKDQVQVYIKRWLILIVFCLVSLLNSFNWIEYSIIQDVVISFYNESLPDDKASRYDAVNWLSMVYMLCYVPLVFPAMFLLERKGLKLSCILGALLTTIGAGIKIAAVQPNLFAVAMTGQTICAIGQAFTLGVPARLSALWFGPNEIGLATSVSSQI